MRVILTTVLTFTIVISIAYATLFFLSGRYQPIAREVRHDDWVTAIEGLLSGGEAEKLRQRASHGGDVARPPSSAAATHQMLGVVMGTASLLQGVVLVGIWWRCRRRWAVLGCLAVGALVGGTLVVDGFSTLGNVLLAGLALTLGIIVFLVKDVVDVKTSAE